MNNFRKMSVAQIERYLQSAVPGEKALRELQQDQRKGVQRLLQKYLARQEAARQEDKRLRHLQSFEDRIRRAGYTFIAGVDEAGRGPLAGPVVAAAVILPEKYHLPGLNDSKKLSPARREKLYEAITGTAVAWAVGAAEVFEIDTYNIAVASKLAMQRALAGLAVKPDFVLVDAFKLDGLPCPQENIIDGDSLCASIAAASVVAKVTRDRLMETIDRLFPGYGFAKHKGYPTPAHRDAIARLGACPLHRQSFLLLPAKEG